MRLCHTASLFACSWVLALASPVLASPGPLFESPHVHPLDVSPDAAHLYAVNTDDHRLSLFDLTQGRPPY